MIEWIIDASMSNDAMLCFCPYENGSAFTGLNIISTELPSGKLVGIIHPDGGDVANAWYETNKARVDACSGGGNK